MAARQESPSVWGVPVKYISLFILVIQNSALVLTMRYSRILPGPRYLPSTAVVLSEILKLVVSTAVYVRQRGSLPSEMPSPLLSDPEMSEKPSAHSFRHSLDEIFGPRSGMVKILIPAILYVMQNNLQFVAASNLDAATFQVSYQCKILTTAVFAVIMLRQPMSARKWIALLVLTSGVACVQIPSSSSSLVEGNWILGMAAVAIACTLSGLAGVYFEKILKGNTSSLWLRNIQLGSASFVIAATGAVVWDYEAIRQNGFFQGYSIVVWATIFVQAMGGLIVALVVKYADNILKGFATSLSIILSTVASIFIFDFTVTRFFLAGSALVFLATYLYTLPEPPTKPLEPSLLDDLESGDDEKR